MAVLTIISCHDESSDLVKKDNPSSSLYYRYINFKQSKQGISPRTDYYSINDALDYLNDGMNFIYCRPHGYFGETIVDIDTFSVEVNGNNEIEETDLIDLMGDIAQFAGDQYWADERSEKQPLMFDVNSVSGASAGHINIQAIFYYEAGLEMDTDDQYPYEDSWLYGQYNLDASLYCSLEEANADAADLYRRDLRRNHVYRSEEKDYYFKDPYYACFTPGPGCASVEIPLSYYDIDFDEYNIGTQLLNYHDVTSNDNDADFIMFENYSGYSGYHECLSESEMNFYFESMEDLINSLLPEPPGVLAIAQVEVGYDRIFFENHTTDWQAMIVIRATVTDVTETPYEEASPLPCCP